MFARRRLTAAAVAAAAATFVLATTPPAVADAASNLLQNAGFESDLTAWTGGSIVTSPVHSGTKALQIKARSSVAQTSVQAVAVTGGTVYQASGWIKVANMAGGARIQ